MPGPDPDGCSGQSEVHCLPARPCRSRQNSQAPIECPAGPQLTSQGTAPSRHSTVPQSSRAHVMTQEKAQVLGSCSSCLDTPPPILVQRSGPLSLRAWAAQTAHAAALARHTFRYAGEQKPRSAPASLSCPKVLVTIRAATLYLCCLQGELGLAGTQEVQSCPHFVGTQQRRLSLQDSALSGENNEAHTHDEAHITGMA